MGVRREKVILELDDQLTSGIVRAAASSALLDKALDRSSGSVRKFGRDSDTAGKEIDRLSGRMRIFADLAAILGPTISPLGASLVTPLVGLTNQFGFAAIAGGSAILAFQGVGDALKAMNEYGLDPSAANAEKLDAAMDRLGDSGQHFVDVLHGLGPEIRQLREAAADGLFPGLIEGIEAAETRLPELQAIIATASSTLGDLVGEAGESLASDEWDSWFETVEREARPALEDMGHSLGNVVAGLAGMWEAFMPLSRDFSTGMLDMSRSFHDWADGLEDSEGFQNFLAYVRDSGPQVREALGAIGNMLVQIAQAAAPLGGPILAGIEAFADAVAAIADSDIGTPLFAGLAALAAWNRAMGVARASTKGFTSSRLAMGAAQRSGLSTLVADTKAWTAFGLQSRIGSKEQAAAGQRLRSTFLKTGGAAAGLALAMSPLPEKVGLSNTAMLAMTGMIAGPWGAAVGGGVGLLMDMAAANDKAADSERRTTDAIKSGSAERVAARLEELKAQQKADNEGAKGDIAGFLNKITPGNAFRAEGASAIAKDIARTKKADAELRASAAETAAVLARTYGHNIAGPATMSLQQFNAAIERTNALLSKEASLDAYEAALDATTDAIKENGRTLDKNTEKGRANRAALRGQAQAAINYAEELAASDKAHDRLKSARVLQRAKKDYIEAATAAGMSRTAARRLASELFDLDRMRVMPKIDVKVAKALGNTRAVWEAINRLHDKDITITTTYVRRNVRETEVRRGNASRGQTGAPSVGNLGMLFHGGARHFALGGFGDVANNHQPELAGPGAVRIWREPETQGEAYIPLANDYRRPRAQAIATETVRLLGGEARFARGGINGLSRDLASRTFSATPSIDLSGARIVAHFPGIGQIEGVVKGIARTEAADVVADYADRADKRGQVGEYAHN